MRRAYYKQQALAAHTALGDLMDISSNSEFLKMYGKRVGQCQELQEFIDLKFEELEELCEKTS